jgi:hypothetical protein
MFMLFLSAQNKIATSHWCEITIKHASASVHVYMQRKLSYNILQVTPHGSWKGT